MKKANSKQIQALAKQAAEIHAQLEAMKPLYNEMDRLTQELLDAGVTGPLVVGDSVFQIVDNFSAKNTVFKTTSVKHFELKIVKGGGK